MEGYPDHLNSKQDYINMLEINPEETVRRLQDLLESRFQWIPTGMVDKASDGIVDETHFVAPCLPEYHRDKDVAIEDTAHMQYEIREDKNSILFLLGFTVSEIEELIAKHKKKE